uniref:Uncharacterized protein n=1 Tax=Myotis lucifugus TaxID=59463 RepID=G1QFG8_MYOLU
KEPGPHGPTFSGPAATREGWFPEMCSLWPGQALSLRSRFQDILAFSVLDGVTQSTERGRVSHEMIANQPACSHPKRTQVLVMGGPGVSCREGAEHFPVESGRPGARLDGAVTSSPLKRILPGMAIGYSSAKLTLHVGEGFQFMKQNDAFNVIITESSDPRGPAELFKEPDYQLMKMALEDGIRWGPGGCRWLRLGLIKDMQHFCRPPFPGPRAEKPPHQVQVPVQELRQKPVELRYCNSDVHPEAFVLPEFAREALNDVS